MNRFSRRVEAVPPGSQAVGQRAGEVATVMHMHSPADPQEYPSKGAQYPATGGQQAALGWEHRQAPVSWQQPSCLPSPHHLQSSTLLWSHLTLHRTLSAVEVGTPWQGPPSHHVAPTWHHHGGGVGCPQRGIAERVQAVALSALNASHAL